MSTVTSCPLFIYSQISLMSSIAGFPALIYSVVTLPLCLQLARDLSTTKLWRKISMMNNRRVGYELEDTTYIKLRKVSLSENRKS